MKTPFFQRHAGLVAVILVLVPVLMILADVSNWAELFAFCANLWTALVTSRGTLIFHFVLMAIALWLLARFLSIVFGEWSERRRWGRFLSERRVRGSFGGNTRVQVLQSTELFAMTRGWTKPITYLSSGLIHGLRGKRLEAILAHEAHHREHHDSLRVFLWRCADYLLPFLPLLRTLARNGLTEIECAADRAALGRGATNAQLLSAIRSVLFGGERHSFSAAGFAVRANLAERVRYLEGLPQRAQQNVVAIAVTLMVLLVFFIPGLTSRTRAAEALQTLRCDAPQQTESASPMSIDRSTIIPPRSHIQFISTQ